MAQQNADIAATYRELYRAKFRDDILNGTTKPFIVPLHFLGIWILPTLYLAIPHRNRPWVYQARWLVLACVVAFNTHMILNVSSHNFASAYGVGLTAAWGIVWNLTVLVWTKPQWEAKRVDIRRKKKQKNGKDDGDNELSAYSSSTKEQSLLSDSVQQRKSFQNEDSKKNAKEISPNIVPPLERNGNGIRVSSELKELADKQEFEYYWQEYPADAPFLTRLDWAFDIVSTFRMTGWNWSIPCIPPYAPPPKQGPYQLPLNTVGPHRTKQGYERQLSYTHFFTTCFFTMIPSYLLLDLCAVHMTADPYFILGPEYNLPLPPHLSTLHPLTLSAQRTALSFLGIVSALQLVFNFGYLILVFLPPLPQILGFRAHPHLLPTPFGSFTRVLDRGLAGFWGDWWHQTFRFGFAAPANWLQRNGYVGTPGSTSARLTGALCAFVTSGFLHASGSYSTVPTHTKWWLPPLFFVFAGVGTTLQSSLCRAPVVKPFIERMPRWVRRLGNLAFVLGWMWATSWALIDDFGRCGLWLYEPVPVSVFRALGYGPTEDRRVWRYERDFWPRWYWGKHWWDTGLGV
ncbi:membrane bound O-acyl transferase family-domain-containing protein [Hypoxylon trugodes]|uniref:membrane bound O-acyl transferase family-domain-containing protein n=1 Tax=Hypoxylon trugodes TaxID=326681 RepID=UPI0021932872|nr:membrane bound O-acyl transferase family-domain-containing protein [Hypoxylon trugodes]KAI1385021.1 membrane bound O-acyl transferase family-domain-containing protein [Hypoxylon trugodes]